MKTAFVNAKVYVEAGHFEEAVLIEGNRIAKVGRRADILSSGADEVRQTGCQDKDNNQYYVYNTAFHC